MNRQSLNKKSVINKTVPEFAMLKNISFLISKKDNGIRETESRTHSRHMLLNEAVSVREEAVAA